MACVLGLVRLVAGRDQMLVWCALNGTSRLHVIYLDEIALGCADAWLREDRIVDQARHTADPVRLMLFPEMDANRDVPEITTSCWGILNKSPTDVMCASARMVVRRKDAASPVVLACTLLAYDPQFELGRTLAILIVRRSACSVAPRAVGSEGNPCLLRSCQRCP